MNEAVATIGVADSVYEAAVQALAMLSKHDWVENVGDLAGRAASGVAQSTVGESGGGRQEAEVEGATRQLTRMQVP